jgi:ketosteroid isomerase-like protein
MLDAKTNPLPCMNRWIALLLLVVPALAFAKGTPLGQAPMPRPLKHESRREIDQLEETWRQAVLTSNTAIMESLLADDYIAISSAGTLQSKEQAIDAMRSGQIHFSSIELSDRKVRFYGTTALVTSRAEVSGTSEEGDFASSNRYTRVYVRDKRGAWKIVSFEISRIRPPGEHR